MPTILVCYYVSPRRHRARAAANLQTWGDRIQRSVYMCTLERDDLAELTNDSD